MSHDYLCLISIYVNGVFSCNQFRLYYSRKSAEKELAIFGYLRTNVPGLFIQSFGIITRRCHLFELSSDYTQNDILSYVDMK